MQHVPRIGHRGASHVTKSGAALGDLRGISFIRLIVSD